MKKFFSILGLVSILLILVGCGKKEYQADYSSAKAAETALNKGKSLKGKTVKIKIKDIEPKSAFGYNIVAGEHLNFVNPEFPDKPKAKKGDSIIVKVEKVASFMGSYIITYELVPN